MSYARRESRAILSSDATVSVERSPPISGLTLDLSLHGLGLDLERGILPGTRVGVQIRMSEGWDDVPELSATVRMSKRDARGRHRLGLAVAKLPPILADYVRQAATPDKALQELKDASFDVRSALSREVLYQAAWARFEARHYEAALSAAECALEGDPQNLHYRALVHRASAEAALVSGHHGDALWHLMKAHAYAPRDAEIRTRLSYLRVKAPPVAWAA